LPFIDDCGLMLEPQEGMSVDEIVSWAKYAEKSGYGFIFRSDHLVPTSDSQKKVPSPECWTSLGAVAASTQRVKFGPMVSPIGFRNPTILANIVCSLYAYSKGRAILAVGAGWYMSEYEAYGFKFPELKQRKEEFHEALQIFHPLMKGEHVTFKGKYFSADMDCYPKPASKIPLIVGARNSQLIKWGAEFADELNMYSPSNEQLSKARRILGDKLAVRGSFIVSQMAPFFIGESQRDLNKRVEKYLEENGLHLKVEDQIRDFRESGTLCGTPDDFIAQIKEKRAAGLDRFYFQLLDPSDNDAAEILTSTVNKV
jgi:alkanesulfonate monooxygenase SsuD/methylene tetrahydromethanopterin reductase-like flavin-dependent oxidoreductase (luciferase family)